MVSFPKGKNTEGETSRGWVHVEILLGIEVEMLSRKLNINI